MNCPQCKNNHSCGCNSCASRNTEGKILSILDGDYVTCGYCGLKMHCCEWLDEEYKQYEETRKNEEQ